MSTSQRQQDELSVLTSIFREDELSVRDDGGVFHANVRTPASLVVTGTNGTRDALTHLPPLSLHFTLPPKYPDTAPPSYMLAGHWLSRGRLSRLCKRLDELYEPGQEVLFTWFSFLQDETWSFLGLPDTLSIAALQRQSSASEGDSRQVVQTQHCGDNNGTTHNGDSPTPDVIANPSESWKGEVSVPVSSALDSADKDSVPSCGATRQGIVVAEPEGCKDPEDCVVDKRAVVEFVPRLRDHLIAHAHAQARADFNRNAQECAVCFGSRAGAQSVLFAPCGHVVCCECAAHYLREASVRGAAVTCPGFECPAPFPHHLARELLSEEEFLSYDSRLLESALSSLADIVRCPRAACQYAVTRDPADGKLATCFRCRYAFCAECRQGYHGVEPCRFRPDEQQRLINEYNSGSSAERAVLEKRYGRRRLEALVESALTQTWLEDNSKPCPHCKAGIQKALGCNKMVCWRCNTHFCWLCATQLDPLVPYAHYLSARSPCHRLLFQGTVPDEDDGDPNDQVEYIEDLDRPAIDM